MAASPQADGNVPIDPVPIPQKPGFLTPEFWVTVVTLLLPVATLIFRQNLGSDQVQTIATAAAGIATAVYTISQALTKSSNARAAATVAAAASQAAAGQTAAPQAGISQARAGQDTQMSPELRTALLQFASQVRGNGTQSQNSQPAIAVFTL